jgi:predicted molibdopterin-dependent oxidoreductase YjgC
MRGHNFHTHSSERVQADIRDARVPQRAHYFFGRRQHLNVHRFEALCHSIIEAGLSTLDYFVQAMTSAMANYGETLAPRMRKAGFRYVFLGIENILESDLQFLRAAAKNAARDNGAIGAMLPCPV